MAGNSAKRDLAVVEAGVLQDVLKKIDELEEQGRNQGTATRTESVHELTTDQQIATLRGTGAAKT